MAKLKLAAVPDNKPVKISLELPAALHRDLVAYAEILAQRRWTDRRVRWVVARGVYGQRATLDVNRLGCASGSQKCPLMGRSGRVPAPPRIGSPGAPKQGARDACDSTGCDCRSRHRYR